jgi:hypothetical protein
MLATRFVVVIAVAVLLVPGRSLAHCDALDGPIVTAAREALRSNDVDLVLIWVEKKDETEVRKAFARTMAVRKLGADAMELADRWFFETVVRIHRMREGEPFHGLKPAGGEAGPAITAADDAIRTGRIESVLSLLEGAMSRSVKRSFDSAMVRKRARRTGTDVETGRRYIAAYMAFVHQVERLYDALESE